jgi:hypothetical protein
LKGENYESEKALAFGRYAKKSKSRDHHRRSAGRRSNALVNAYDGGLFVPIKVQEATFFGNVLRCGTL